MIGSPQADIHGHGPDGGKNAQLRGPLKWGLLATLLATAASLVWPTHAVVDAQSGDHVETSGGGEPRAVTSAAPPPATAASLTGVANLQPLQEAGAASAIPTFDPFVGVVPPPPPPAPIPQPLVVAPPPPAPPPQDYRFLGRLTGPDGVEQVLLMRGDSVAPVKTGTTLDNGYVVETIGSDAVLLIYPPLGTKATIPISPLQPPQMPGR